MKHKDLANLCAQLYEDRFTGSVDIGGTGAFCSVFAAMRGDAPIVAFRGSTDIAGWAEDADIRFTAHAWGKVHHGFDYSWLTLRREVLKAIGSTPVILTGHSYGGAIATIAAADPSINVAQIVTFGCPRVGDAEFASNYAAWMGSRTTRYVHRLDPVPWLPGAIAGYRHVCQSRWYDGERWQDGCDWWHLAKLGFHVVAGAFAGRGSFLARLIGQHSIARYAEAL